MLSSPRVTWLMAYISARSRYLPCSIIDDVFERAIKVLKHHGGVYDTTLGNPAPTQLGHRRQPSTRRMFLAQLTDRLPSAGQTWLPLRLGQPSRKHDHVAIASPWSQRGERLMASNRKSLDEVSHGWMADGCDKCESLLDEYLPKEAATETQEKHIIHNKTASVVGATGFVGSHIVQHLAQSGYNVRCATRDVAAAEWLLSLSEGSGSITLHHLELTDTGPVDDKLMDDLMTGTSAAFFAAGYETQSPSTIKFMVNNAKATVAAARRNGVKTVVLTSSGGSTNAPGLAASTPKSEITHWSDPDKQQEAGRYSPAAKTLMELSALESVGRDRTNAIVDHALAAASPRLCIMNPNLILGPQLKPGVVSGNSLPWIARILTGETMNETIPNDSMSIIDVRDLAALHVACAEKEDASGRYFGVHRSWPWEVILDTLARVYPPYASLKPRRFEGEAALPTQFDHTRKNSLGVELRTLDDTLRDLIVFMQQRGVLPIQST